MDLFSMVKEYLKPSTLNLDFMDTVFLQQHICTNIGGKKACKFICCLLYLFTNKEDSV